MYTHTICICIFSSAQRNSKTSFSISKPSEPSSFQIKLTRRKNWFIMSIFFFIKQKNPFFKERNVFLKKQFSIEYWKKNFQSFFIFYCITPIPFFCFTNRTKTKIFFNFVLDLWIFLTLNKRKNISLFIICKTTVSFTKSHKPIKKIGVFFCLSSTTCSLWGVPLRLRMKKLFSLSKKSRKILFFSNLPKRVQKMHFLKGSLLIVQEKRFSHISFFSKIRTLLYKKVPAYSGNYYLKFTNEETHHFLKSPN